jgi:hypothetical protein
MTDIYVSILEELKSESVDFVNKLIYIMAPESLEEIFEEIIKDSKLFDICKKLAVLTLQDYLMGHPHFKYTGDDKFIIGSQRSCDYHWFMLDDTIRTMDKEIIKNNLLNIAFLTLQNILNFDKEQITWFVILAKTSFAECYIRLLCGENK